MPQPQKTRSIAALGGADKAAALLLGMDKQLAKRLMKYLDENELKQFAESAAQLGSLAQPVLEEVVQEFASAFSQGSDVQGSPQAAASLLEGLVPGERLSDIMTDIAGNSSTRVWGTLASVPEASIAQYLSRQHPQVVTYVLSKLSGGQVAAVLEQFTVPQRVDAMRRMLSLKEVSEPALRTLEGNLASELVGKASRNSAPDVHARIASVLNKMNRETADAAFTGLSASRPKDAEKIKGLLFTFNDIARLSVAARTKLFEDLPVEQTIAALQAASTELQADILNCLSQRSRRMIEAELTSGRAASKAEIAKAQRLIAERALELVDRGIIELGSDPS